MLRALLLPLLLTAAASAQTPDVPAPADSTLSDALSDGRLAESPEALRAFAERQLGSIVNRGACAQAAPMPTLGMGGPIRPAPMPQADLTGGLQPAPMPNLCGQSLAVLPPGVRFRTDPLPPGADDDLGRQLLREQGADPSNALRRLQGDIEWLREQRRLDVPARRLEVALPAHRP